MDLKDKLAGKIEVTMNIPRKHPARNTPCTCGSKKKFKHCCGKLVNKPIEDKEQ